MKQLRPPKNSPGQSPDSLEYSFLDTLRLYSFQKQLELLLCILVITVLVALALTQSSAARRKAKIISVVANHEQTRTAIHYYHALYGTWPDREATLALICQLQPDACQEGHNVNNLPPLTAAILTVEQGGVTLATPGLRPSEDRQLTLHPATLTEDPLGPVIWLAGPAVQRGWTSMGRDRTDVSLLPFIQHELQ